MTDLCPGNDHWTDDRAGTFSGNVAALNPMLPSLAQMGRCRHTQRDVNTVARRSNSKTVLSLSKADRVRCTRAIVNFLNEITELGWPDA